MSSRTDRAVRAILALVPPLVAFGAQWLLWAIIRPYAWFLFYPAIFISSSIGGRRSGIVATLLSTFLVWWFFVPPEHTFFAKRPHQVFPALVFFGMGVLFVVFHDRLRKANAHLEKAVADREVFAAFLENSSDFIGIADPNGKPTYVNPAGRRMVGLSMDHPIEDTQIPEYYPPEVATDAILEGMLQKGRWEGETYFRNWETGEAIPVSDKHFLIKDPASGLVLGMGTITRDVTDLRRAHEETETAVRHLRDANAEITNLSDASLDVSNAMANLPQTSVRGVLETVALAAQRLTSAEFAALGMVGDPAKSFDPWVFVGMPPEMAAKIGTCPRPHGLLGVAPNENRTLRLADLRTHPDHRGFPDHHPVMTSLLAVPIVFRGQGIGNLYLTNKRGAPEFTDQDQRIVEMLASRVGAAIETVRLYATKEIKHAWLQAVVDQMPEGIVLMDAEGRVTAANQSVTALAGPEPHERDRFGNVLMLRLQRPSGEPLAPDDLPIVRAMAGEATQGMDLLARTADGQSIPVLVSAAPVRGPSAELAGAMMIIENISVMKQLEQLREEWASIVAHDLQQPINSITLMSDLLLRSEIDDQQRKDVQLIRTSAKRLARMVGDLSDATLLETRRMHLVFDRVDMGTLVGDVVARIPDVASRTHVHAPADHPIFVQGDAGRLEQVIVNLLSNAAKYAADDTEIELDVNDTDGCVEIAVANRGPGIPVDELETMFERYTRSRALKGSTKKGSGLGLYIAKGLVEAHGGHIWAESIPRETTTFHFTIPLDASAGAEARPSP